jgi:hypothetical protein
MRRVNFMLRARAFGSNLYAQDRRWRTSGIEELEDVVLQGEKQI